MNIDTARLRAELLTDPLGLGYGPLLAQGSDSALAALLNAAAGPGAARVTLPSLDRDTFLLGIAPAYLVLPTLPNGLQAKWDRILGVIRAAGSLQTGSPALAGLLDQAVADGVLTGAQLEALTTRIGARAEVLFGAGALVGTRDVSLALRGQK